MSNPRELFSDAHLAAFEQDGCVVVEGFLSPEEVQALRKRTGELLQKFDPHTHPIVTFATGTQDGRHIGDQYFFDSATLCSYFLEEDAMTDEGLSVAPERAINKIGHGLHIAEPQFCALTHSQRVRYIAERLGYSDPRVLQSMVICKQPGIGGAVPMHQDSTFLFTNPPSACGFWIALEDCTLENGCLEFIPGSHRTTPITRRFVRADNPKDANAATEMVAIEPTFSLFPPLKKSDVAAVPAASPELDDVNCKPVEVRSGSLVLIHGQVLHRSAHNHSEHSRWIYTFHIVEGANEYDQRNWLQMPAGQELTKL
ncbi:hypothetical protein H4R20_001471 [Coemansia guatemalensis]|uniref:Phytanoyl-CoA dioxygenase n=1 Tax=Coemansia guatemalensis TaxID=2761395 RepID=A0A9W8I1V1_9FUNG|nr:hypothetical protein H4R20_001471 [Coemansia guatemalensis]